MKTNLMLVITLLISFHSALKMEVGEEFMKEFKRSYHQNGKFDLESQVPYLAQLAEHYKHKYVAERD